MIVVNVAMMFAALVLLVVVSSLFPYLVVFLFPAVIILFTSSYCSGLSFFLLEVAVGGTGRLCFSGWALPPCGGDRLAIGSRSLL